MKANDSNTVIIRMGVFFDGTELDAFNAMKHTTDEGLFSNIYRLYLNYEGYSDATGIYDDSLKVYVEGVGMYPDHSDPDKHSKLAAAVGIDFDILGFSSKNELGVFNKHKFAVERLYKLLDIYIKQNLLVFQDKTIHLEFDVFGFSRGAASARHFANMINDSDSDTITPFNTIITQNNSVIGTYTNNFIGLFDTVPTIWSLTLENIWKDPHDSGSTNGLHVNLPENIANGVLQLTAQHECRYNLGLNSVKGFYPELELAGAHSDVGGGYDTIKENDYRITDDHDYIIDSLSQKRCEKELDDAKNTDSVRWSHLINNDYITYDRAYIHAKQGIYRHTIKGNLQYVALMLMSEAATAVGCKFKNDIFSYEDNIVSDLQPYYADAKRALTLTLNGENATINQDLIDAITDEYIHVSVDWMNVVLQQPLSEGLYTYTNEDGSYKLNYVDEQIVGSIFDIIADVQPERSDTNWVRKIWNNNQTLSE